MKQVKCFFKIQIPVCRITMRARGFAVWTTPLTARCLTPIPDILKRYRGFFEEIRQRHRVWTTPTPRGDWTEKSRYPKRYRDFFYKKLKNSAQPGIYSERRWSHDKEFLRCSHVPLIFRHSFFKGVFTWTDIFSPLFRRSFMTCGSAIFIPRLSASLTAPLIITNKT